MPRKNESTINKSNIDALNLKDDDLIFDSDDEKRNQENNKKLKDILQQAVEGPSKERKEKLKLKTSKPVSNLLPKQYEHLLQRFEFVNN